MNDISHRYKMHPPFLASMGVALFAIMIGDGFVRRIECMIGEWSRGSSSCLPH